MIRLSSAPLGWLCRCGSPAAVYDGSDFCACASCALDAFPIESLPLSCEAPCAAEAIEAFTCWTERMRERMAESGSEAA